MRPLRYLVPLLAVLVLSASAQAAARRSAPRNSPSSGSPTSTAPSPTGGPSLTGGAGLDSPPTLPTGPAGPSTTARPTVPGLRARIIRGIAYAPAAAPLQVKRIIWAGNKIRRKPYVFGGGHGIWNDGGYDCSGSVSYVLHAAGLLPVSMDSTEFESWGDQGTGQWVTVYANAAHAFLQVAGIRLDTSAQGDPHPTPGSGPRWHPVMRRTRGFLARHPLYL